MSDWPEMGIVVTVSRELFRHFEDRYSDNETYLDTACRWRSRKRPARAGWVVGRRHLPRGRIVTGDYARGPGEWRDDGGRTPAILVAFWPTMKPIHVPLDGWEAGGEPYPPNGSPEERKWMKAIVKECPSAFPRDDKGRFI